ncbi:MAG: phytoene desaturase family protein [Sandaracinaceae bacterium]
MRHIAVVGGGPAGLFAALTLAQQGHEVSVFESGAFGGRARSLGPEGYPLNLGPHALYPASNALLRRQGIEVQGGAPKPAGFRMVLDGETVPLPSGAMGLLSHRALRMSEKLVLARWLARISERRARGLHAVPTSAWLNDAGLTGSARKVAEMLVRLTSYVNAPERFSAGAAMGQLAAGLQGVLYVHGGWQSIVDAMLGALRERGVTLHDQVRVAAVGPEGVTLVDERIVNADAVLLAVSPKVAARLLGASASPCLVEYARTAVAVRAACLDVASAALPGVASIVLGADEPTYLSVPSVSARVAPAGSSVVHVARYLTPGEPAPKGIRSALEASLAAAHPDLATHVVHARYAPAMTVMHALPEAEDGGLAARPDIDDAGPSWACLAGDWVGPEGMLLDAALLSAERAAVRLGVVERVASTMQA